MVVFSVTKLRGRFLTVTTKNYDFPPSHFNAKLEGTKHSSTAVAL
jgi:hypothetical protein